jgi:hypothetical protein
MPTPSDQLPTEPVTDADELRRELLAERYGVDPKTPETELFRAVIDRERFCRGLLELARWYYENPEWPVPSLVSVHARVDDAEQLVAVAQACGGHKIYGTAPQFDHAVKISGIEYVNILVAVRTPDTPL